MQISKISKGLLLSLLLLLASGAFAANKASMRVDNPLSVAGQQLNSGDYTVTWDGNGPDIQLSILKGKHVVATVPARIVSRDRAPERDSTVVRMDGSNRTLSEIRFSGKKYALAIGDAGAGTASGSSVR